MGDLAEIDSRDADRWGEAQAIGTPRQECEQWGTMA